VGSENRMDAGKHYIFSEELDATDAAFTLSDAPAAGVQQDLGGTAYRRTQL